jgi:hypothetical protein
MASAAVIAPATAAAGAGGSLTAAIQTPMLAAISTGPFGCKTASATPAAADHPAHGSLPTGGSPG